MVLNVGIGLAFLCLSLFAMWGAVDLEYYTDLGPGPGFFPFWLGATMALLSASWLVRCFTTAQQQPAGPLIPGRRGQIRILCTVAALVFYQLVSEILGFRLTMLAVLFFVLYVSERLSLAVSATIAIVGSFGAYILFHDLLNVYLPFASIPFLEPLGL